jgi:hypothetical protein
MSTNFNLHPHVVLPKSLHPNARKQGLMVRHPLPEIPYHGPQRFVIKWEMVGPDVVDLRPAFPARGAQGEVDVLEGLVDLRVDFGRDGFDALVGEPTAWWR